VRTVHVITNRTWLVNALKGTHFEMPLVANCTSIRSHAPRSSVPATCVLTLSKLCDIYSATNRRQVLHTQVAHGTVDCCRVVHHVCPCMQSCCWSCNVRTFGFLFSLTGDTSCIITPLQSSKVPVVHIFAQLRTSANFAGGSPICHTARRTRTGQQVPAGRIVFC